MKNLFKIFNSIQFNSIQFNSIQFNSIQFNSIQFNSIQFNSIHKNFLVFIFLFGLHFSAGFAQRAQSAPPPDVTIQDTTFIPLPSIKR
jgi:hypothetical protein